MVDRPAVRALLAAMDVVAPAGLAVVCIDGTPAPLVRRIARGSASSP